MLQVNTYVSVFLTNVLKQVEIFASIHVTVLFLHLSSCLFVCLFVCLVFFCLFGFVLLFFFFLFFFLFFFSVRFVSIRESSALYDSRRT